MTAETIKNKPISLYKKQMPVNILKTELEKHVNIMNLYC